MLPEWNAEGVLPSVVLMGSEGIPREFCAHITTLCEMIGIMGTTNERLDILEGFLNYRVVLRKLGIVNGFQWVDGSFVENIEALEFRAPRDIDVVTFCYLPPDMTQKDIRGGLEHGLVKNTYKVDSYYLFLGEPLDAARVKMISYWNTIWSHSRDGVWKGFLYVPLCENDDTAAGISIAQRRGELSDA